VAVTWCVAGAHISVPVSIRIVPVAVTTRRVVCVSPTACCDERNECDHAGVARPRKMVRFHTARVPSRPGHRNELWARMLPLEAVFGFRTDQTARKFSRSHEEQQLSLGVSPLESFQRIGPCHSSEKSRLVGG